MIRAFTAVLLLTGWLASTVVQAEVRAAGAHALRGFAVDGGDDARFPIVLLAVHAGADHFKGQGAFDEDDFAVRAAGDALGIDVEGFHRQPAFRQCGFGSGGRVVARGGEQAVFVGERCGHPPIVSGRETGSRVQPRL